MPLPGIGTRPVARGICRPRLRAAPTMAAPSGCSLACSMAAAEREHVPARIRSPRTTTEASRRLALGERAGLVDDERVHLLEPFERFGVPDEHAGRRAAAGADHDGHRRREPERARARDDEHGHGAHERQRQAGWRSPDDSTRQTPDRDEHDRGHEPGRDPVGQPLNRRAAALRLGDLPDNLREEGLAADALGPHQEGAGRVDGAADHARSPGALSTGIDSPVTSDSSMALCPSTTTPSTGTFSPGRTRQMSPTTTSFRVDVPVEPAPHHARGLRREAEQLLGAPGWSGCARAARAPARPARAR